MIPKILHFVWIGDETNRPDDCIQSWAEMNPDFKIKIWGNAELNSNIWFNADHIHAFAKQELCGAADLMRYEILFQHGGLTLDADSFCMRPIENWLLETDLFATWENEYTRPGLITNAFMGATPQNAFLAEMIGTLRASTFSAPLVAWKTVGPNLLTDQIMRKRPPLTIYPSHYFSPEHFSGLTYKGLGKTFAKQMWASTKTISEAAE